MTFLVALVVGALRAPVVQAGRALPGGWTQLALVEFAVAAVVGTAFVIGIDRAAGGDVVTADA